MIDAKDERHRYGQHYTPPAVAKLLAAFAVRASDDLVFDPSCGDGRLLAESLRVKQQLNGPRKLNEASLADQVYGIDRSAVAVSKALETGARVAVADFFDVDAKTGKKLPDPAPLIFDAVIGNPPYIRQEVIGPSDKRRIEARIGSDRSACGDVFWPQWSRRSDIYVYFFAHSICFLKSNGRLVFITASSWLDAGYGSALREFLLENFRVIAVIESAAESFFSDASINTCITVLEREVDCTARNESLVRFVTFDKRLNEILADGRDSRTTELAADIENGVAPSNAYHIRLINQSALLSASTGPAKAFVHGWGRYLRADEVFFKVIERGSNKLRSLSNMASVRFGVKTGANEFFYIKGDRRNSNGKRAGLRTLSEVASVRRGITTGANEFFYLSRDQAISSSDSRRDNGQLSVRDWSGRKRQIEAELLSPVVFSLKEIPGILVKSVEPRRWLFNCQLAPDALGSIAREYIESGERAGYDRRPTCSNREPWYSVLRGMKPAPLIFPSKVGERWLVALNLAKVFEDKKLYGVFPARGISTLVLAALLNSTWARYYAEVTCRQMTGAQAIADIDVVVAEQILLPDPRELSRTIKKKLELALKELSRRPIDSVFEEIRRADRRRLDELILEAIGFKTKAERKIVLDDLYRAVSKLVRGRLSKSSKSSTAAASTN